MCIIVRKAGRNYVGWFVNSQVLFAIWLSTLRNIVEWY